MMRAIADTYRRINAFVACWWLQKRYDDRGEINASVAWTGAMVVLAVTIAAIVATKAEDFANGIDFGGN